MKQFSKFLLVGAANTALGYAVIFGCMYVGDMSPEFSNVVGYAAGFGASYLLNRNFTFKSAQRRSTEFIRFSLVFLVAYLANLSVLILLVRALVVHTGISQIVAGVIYVATSYLLNKHYVFRSSKAG